jgi:hypothetical protein
MLSPLRHLRRESPGPRTERSAARTGADAWPAGSIARSPRPLERLAHELAVVGGLEIWHRAFPGLDADVPQRHARGGADAPRSAGHDAHDAALRDLERVAVHLQRFKR